MSGKKEADERYMQTAYREIREETGLNEAGLRLLAHGTIRILDNRGRRAWSNRLFIFSSNTRKISRNFEHTSHKWVSYGELLEERAAMDSISNRKRILASIRSCTGR